MLFALDMDWWRRHLAEARNAFRGALVSPQDVAGVTRIRGWWGTRPCNSGAAALALAAYSGAQRVVLLGYDCQHTAGRRHWHGDHPAGMRNADGVADWPAHFQELLPRLSGIEVVNASRETALGLFPRVALEEALA